MVDYDEQVEVDVLELEIVLWLLADDDEVEDEIHLHQIEIVGLSVYEALIDDYECFDIDDEVDDELVINIQHNTAHKYVDDELDCLPEVVIIQRLQTVDDEVDELDVVVVVLVVIELAE